MNERIRELAKQAREEVRAEWDKGNKIPYPEAHYEFQNDNDQKFAELIVRECASIDFYKLAHIGTEDDYNVTQVIKQHFGVEE